MPIKDEELRKIIKILVDKDKDKKARKKSRKKRRRATGGASGPGGMPSTAQMEPTQGIGSRPGSLMGSVNYWGGGGGGGGGALGPTRQEIQNLIQSNLTGSQPPLGMGPPPSALPPSLADETIFDMPERNILTQDQETNTPEMGAKWTFEELMDDSFGNFAGGTASDEFLDPQQMPVATPYGVDDIKQEDIPLEDIPPEETVAEEDQIPVVISPTKIRKPRRTAEEKFIDDQQSLFARAEKVEKSKSKLGKKAKLPPGEDTSIYTKRTPTVSYAPEYEN